MRRNILFLLSSFVFVVYGYSQETTSNNQWLKEDFKKHPEADTDKDNTLTSDEELIYQQEFLSGITVVPTLTVYKTSCEEVRQIIGAGNRNNIWGPLNIPKGNGLRICMTGHSWVRPGQKIFPIIAEAAGYDNLYQRWHISGGATGEAYAIWKREFGQ